MIPTYIPILKAKKGEFLSLSHLKPITAQRIVPLLDLPRVTAKTLTSRKYRTSATPVMDYVNNLVINIANCCSGRPVFVDTMTWPANARIEDGEHILTYVMQQLENAGVIANPVIGYDRWDSQEYRLAVKNIDLQPDRRALIRLDTEAIEDLLDLEYFHERLNQILAHLGHREDACGVLVDLGNATFKSIEDIQEDVYRSISALRDYGFTFVAMAGCSMPATIVDAVRTTNSSASVVRREMVAWRSLKLSDATHNLVFADYGIRNPNALEDVIAPHTNGKIRYTVDQAHYVVRGYSKQFGLKGAQVYELAQNVVRSPHWLGATFSWGDEQIVACSEQRFKGGGTEWIAIDTNHHIEYVVAEVLEFEKQTAAVA